MLLSPLEMRAHTHSQLHIQFLSNILVCAFHTHVSVLFFACCHTQEIAKELQSLRAAKKSDSERIGITVVLVAGFLGISGDVSLLVLSA